MKGYKIWCEWDMRMDWENTVFLTKEEMNNSLKVANWKKADITLEEDLVGFDEITIK